MMYVELHEQTNMVIFSAELSKRLKLEHLSPVFVSKIKGKSAFVFQKAPKKAIGVIHVGFAEGGRRKQFFSILPTPIAMMTELGYSDKKAVRLKVREGRIEDTGEKFYYIGEKL